VHSVRRPVCALLRGAGEIISRPTQGDLRRERTRVPAKEQMPSASTLTNTTIRGLVMSEALA
jgi:hypothetical protein